MEAMRQGPTDDRIDLLRTALGEVDRKVDKVDAKVDQLEIKVDQLEIKVDRVDARVDKLDAKIDRNGSEMTREFIAVRGEMKAGFDSLYRLMLGIGGSVVIALLATRI